MVLACDIHCIFLKLYITKCTLTAVKEKCTNSDIIFAFLIIKVSVCCECANRPQVYMHIWGVCMCAKYEDICVRASVCQRAALVWPACKATNSIVGSSSCSFRAGSLSCLGENDKPKRMLWRRWGRVGQTRLLLVNKDV